MKIAQFIEKAIEGGDDLGGNYLNSEKLGYPKWEIVSDTILGDNIEFRQVSIGFGGDPTPVKWRVSVRHILLRPETWKAVGKVEGWATMCIPYTSYSDTSTPVWQYQMHRMIDALAEGKSIEEYLQTL